MNTPLRHNRKGETAVFVSIIHLLVGCCTLVLGVYFVGVFRTIVASVAPGSPTAQLAFLQTFTLFYLVFVVLVAYLVIRPVITTGVDA